MADGAVFLVTGPSASGKSTVGRLLAHRFERGVYLEGDVFRRSIVSGRVEMTPEASSEALRQLRLRYRLAAGVVDAYASEGFAVVVEDVVVGTFLTEYIALIRSRPLHVVVLAPTLSTVASREAARAGGAYAHFPLDELHSAFMEETPRIGLWVDNSEQSPDETVDEILARRELSRVIA